jgi:hypothetical protein
MINPPNELDDLKVAWQMLSQQLQRQNALTSRLFREKKTGKLRTALLPLVTGQAIQVIGGVVLSLIFAPFWVRHLGQPHLVIYGLSLHIYGMMLIAFAVRDLVLISRIDYAAPVVAIQKQIAELRSWHLRAGWWFAVTGCLMWTPLLLCAYYAVGADLWLTKPVYVYLLVLSSVICLALCYGLVVWSRRPSQARLAQYLANTSAGRTVSRAEAMLREIEEFERA